MSLRILRLLVVAIATNFFVLAGPPDASADSASTQAASHKQVRVIRPKLESRPANLNTFAMSPTGELWLCCDNPQSRETETSENPKPGCLLIYSVEGALLRSVELEFVPQAINFSQSGVPFLAGDGKVARLTSEGQVDLAIEAPNLLPEDELKAKLVEKNKAMIDQLLEGGESQVKRIEEQIAKLETTVKETEDKEGNERLKARNENRLTVLKQQLDMQKQMLDTQKSAYENMLGADVSVAQVKRSSGIAIAKDDLFVSLPSIEGQGYAVYRLTHDLTEPKLVVDSLSGCCGQLDIQSDGTHLIVAANSDFKVRYFDRDGVALHSFGDRSDTGGDASLSGWGSCCNPMNVRCIDDKEILVAESSIGHIKRYTPNGDFLGLVGTAKIAGGCKHVAIAKDSQRDWYFMMNTAGNNIAVLVPLSEAPAETEDERDSRLAMEGLGQKLIGAWKAELKDSDKQSSDQLEVSDDEVTEESDAEETVEVAIATDSFDYGQYIVDQNRYIRLGADGKVSRTEPVTANTASKSGASQGLFGAIASLFIGGASSAGEAIAAEETQWVAIRQDGDVIQFGLVESEVQNYAVAVRFIDDERAEFKWYFSEVSGEPMATSIYRKVAGDTQPEACDPSKCKGADCDKENCEHKHKIGDETSAGDSANAVQESAAKE